MSDPPPIPVPKGLEPVLRWAEEFNGHLNECEYCREHPASLCEKGLELLRAMPREEG